MNYEEKLDKILSRLNEERKMTRKGQTSKLAFHLNSFQTAIWRIEFADVLKILLQLQDDEKVIKITDTFTEDNPFDPYEQAKPTNYDEVRVVEIQFGSDFDTWYADYASKKRSSLENLDWLNILKVLDVSNDIAEKLQINSGSSVLIPSFPYPYIGRYLELFPVDTVGTRKSYQQHRWEGAQYLKKIGIALSVQDKTNDFLGYGNFLINVDQTRFYDFYSKLKEIFDVRKKDQEKHAAQPKQPISPQTRTAWSDKFFWQDKKFVFGDLGSIDFTSKERRHIFEVLTGKKGNWAPMSELKGDKDANYVRSSIKQIEDRLPPKLKIVMKIVSTLEDDLPEKPKESAYRIRYTPLT